MRPGETGKSGVRRPTKVSFETPAFTAAAIVCKAHLFIDAIRRAERGSGFRAAPPFIAGRRTADYWHPSHREGRRF
jgi:hypothetical protein